MTKSRTSAHNLFNCFFVGGFCFVAIGAVVAATSFFQGEKLDAWTMISVAGNTFNGVELPLILRLEALYAMIAGALFLGSSFLGFTWLYDKEVLSTVRKWSILNMCLAIGWQSFFFSTIQIPDPISLIAFGFLVAFFLIANKVEEEKSAR